MSLSFQLFNFTRIIRADRHLRMDSFPLLNHGHFHPESDYQQRRRTQNRLAQRRFRLCETLDVPIEATNSLLGERERFRKVEVPPSVQNGVLDTAETSMNQGFSRSEDIASENIFPDFSPQGIEEQELLSFPYNVRSTPDALLPVEQQVSGLLPNNECNRSSNINAM